MLRLMVQGDRDARGIEDAVRRLGKLCKEREIGLNVGEAGKIVHLLAETGAHVRVHQAKPEPPNVPDSAQVGVIDCVGPARVANRDMLNRGYFSSPRRRREQRLAWAVRLAELDNTSDGFIFFPGWEGTLAHLVPIMAFIKKGEWDRQGHERTRGGFRVKGVRRIALFNWKDELIKALANLFGKREIHPHCAHNDYIAAPSYDGKSRCSSMEAVMQETIRWLTEDLPE